ncbi:SDR family oxidoreductase [Streptomyces sp. NPDC048179]|uniref:SDR family oxidoreductase n=1 Tax=Streptomyces sp. NPDC048179 TaxID=3365506 RepID=UPI003723B36A
MTLGTAVIVGVGPGIGLAIARTFARAGHPVAMLARDEARLGAYAADLASAGHEVRGYVADAGDPDALRGAIHRAVTELGGDDQDWADVTAVNVLGSRVAADAVLPELRDGRGSLLFTGGGYALSPSKEHASLSVGKAALRAYVHVRHDQLSGTGVHATSVTITRDIGGGEARFDPEVLAQAYLDLHRQPASAWQHELMRY